VIVDKKGYILTNNLVVNGAAKIQVQWNGDSPKYTAKVVGTDEGTDLEANRDLPVAKLGNSHGVRVGDWVLAIGSPFGLKATVTTGIVSAKDRGSVGANSNNSCKRMRRLTRATPGGPLVDMAGQMIAINTAIVTQSTGYRGVGFALP
jgi:serine protease Do